MRGQMRRGLSENPAILVRTICTARTLAGELNDRVWMLRQELGKRERRQLQHNSPLVQLRQTLAVRRR